MGSIEPRRLIWMAAVGLRDQLRALLGRAPHYVPIAGPAGSYAGMTSDDAGRAYPALYPPGFDFRNEFGAGVLNRARTYSPGRGAARIACPLLVIAGDGDTITPAKPARRAARRAPRGEFVSYPGTHFEIYHGERFEWAVERETEFLRATLLAG